MSLYRLKGTAGAVINRNFDLDRPIQIGANGGIPATDAAAAEVRFADGRITLTRLGDTPVQVNGEPVDTTALVGGDEIRVAGCRYLVQAPGLRPERVLTEDAVRPRRSPWGWLLALLLVVVVVAVTGWKLGWFESWQDSPASPASPAPSGAPAAENVSADGQVPDPDPDPDPGPERVPEQE